MPNIQAYKISAAPIANEKKIYNLPTGNKGSWRKVIAKAPVFLKII